MLDSVTLADLADYTSRDGNCIRPGAYGVSRGGGILSALIRHASESEAGHAFVHIGNGQIVEGTAPVARVASADSHPDALWNIREPLTDEQRLTIVARAQALVGIPYDFSAYIGFALEMMGLRTQQELDEVYQFGGWRVCSALVADCYLMAGIDVDPDSQYSNLVSPADLLRRITRMGASE